MKWLNHMIIAGSVCAVVSPPHVAACVAGATAPDWGEWLLKITGKRIKHRGSTHILTHWLLTAVALTLIWDFYGIGLEENSSIITHGPDNLHWKLEPTDYADAVRLVEAAADMLMYILPHIGTAEVFEQFMAEHDAGKTNFAQLVLPETNPNKKRLIDVLQ